MTDLAALRVRAWKRLLNASPDAWVLDHARHVEALAVAMARHGEAALDLVHAGALLHDIGRSKTHGVSHAWEGAQLLREDGDWDERLVLAVERHTGAGIPRHEAVLLGLPDRDFVPLSLEEKIVAHADNLYSGSKRLSLAELEEKYLRKGLPEAWRRIEALHRELEGHLGISLETLEPARLSMP